MNKYLTILVGIFILLIAGCTKTDTPCLEKDGCTMSCQQKLVLCEQFCKDNCQSCEIKSSIRAKKKYARYVHQQKTQGGFITKLGKSYKDPLQCMKTTCNCLADYNVCVQAKSRFIQKRLAVRKACTWV